MSNPNISTITLPSGTTYDICDVVAREAASHGMQLIKCTNAADTPYGVTWKDGGTTITGTLVASSTTSGKMYLVPVETPDDKDIFAEYVTVASGAAGSETYSWEKIGTTDIDLSNLGDLAYKDTASGNFTPQGSVAAPVISVETAGSTASVTPFGTAGTLPELTMTVSDGNLAISFSQGTLPTAGSNVTVKTGDAAYSATAPAFTGTQGSVTVS